MAGSPGHWPEWDYVVAESTAAQRLLIGSLLAGKSLPLEDLAVSVPGTVSLAAAESTVFAASAADTGEMLTFHLTGDGLSLQSRTPSGGVEPCHLVVDPTGRYLLTTNYGSSSLVVRPISDGHLGEITDVVEISGSGPVLERQQSSHFHQALFAPSGDVALVCDLGADALHGFRWDPAAGKLAHSPLWSASSPPGSGPRHGVFHPQGVLVADELSSTVSWYATSDQGQLTWVRSTPSTFGGSGNNYPSDIVLSPDGRFAYVGNRGFDTIGIVSVSSTSMMLIAEVPAAGKWPQHLMLSGNELFCAVRDSNAVNIFDVDSDSGGLRLTSKRIPVAGPTWILEVAA